MVRINYHNVMMVRILLLLCGLFCWKTSLGQDAATLFLQDNKLEGTCSNRYFTGFSIELDSSYTRIDSASLFAQFPRIGKLNFKNRIKITTEFTLTQRAGYDQIMFRFKNDYLTFDHLKINDESIEFTINNDPVVPVTKKDLEIIRLAKSLLSDEKFWNSKDDRICSDDLANKKYSIYCALRIASLEIEGKYNHRNAVMQSLRHMIVEKYPNKQWSHRLMDFNNMEEIGFGDILSMLNEIEHDFIREIE